MNAILSIQTTLYFIACNGEDTYYSGFSSKATPHTFLKDYGSWHSRALLLVVWSCVSCWSWYDDHTSWLLLRLLSCFSVCLSHTDSVRPHRGSPPGSAGPGILQARTLPSTFLPCWSYSKNFSILSFHCLTVSPERDFSLFQIPIELSPQAKNFFTSLVLPYY